MLLSPRAENRPYTVHVSRSFSALYADTRTNKYLVEIKRMCHSNGLSVRVLREKSHLSVKPSGFYSTCLGPGLTQGAVHLKDKKTSLL